MDHNLPFTHFLFTRFNLTNADPKNINAGLTTEWMDNRLDLFQRYTLPCVASQKNTQFRWVVFFDVQTQEKYVEKIQELAQKYAVFEPVFIDVINSLPAATRRIFNTVQTPYVISSRIDNDDCISDRYIDVVQDHFVEQHRTVIDLVDGLQMQVKPFFKIGKKRKPFNPFISFIEKTDQAEGIFVRVHGQWKMEDRLIQITGLHHWMAVIHQGNIANHFTAFGHVKLNKVRACYHFDKTLMDRAENDAQYVFETPVKSAYHCINDHQKHFFKHAERRLKVWFTERVCR